MEHKVKELRIFKSRNLKEGKMKRKVILSLVVVVLLLVSLVGGGLLTKFALAEPDTSIPPLINY